jgi:hypothetical protein
MNIGVNILKKKGSNTYPINPSPMNLMNLKARYATKAAIGRPVI